VGCGRVTVRISCEGDQVIWDSWLDDDNRPPGRLLFAKGQYLQVLNEAIHDTSWETPDRTAARLLASLVDHEALAVHNLRLQWASGRLKAGTLSVSLEGPPGYHQILVHTAWGDETPEQIAQKVAAILKEHPGKWTDVVSYRQNPIPLFDGPEWRK
jgi:hypothetical protein